MKRWFMTGTLLLGIYGASWGTVSYMPSTSDKPTTNLAQVETAIAEKPLAKAAVQAPFKLERANGIAVTDDLNTLYEIKGKPLSIEQDPLFKHERILVYEDCKVGLYEQFIQYVVILPETGTFELDGKTLPMQTDQLREALGQPDWVAEDGLVYRSGNNVLKLFIQPGTGELTSVHYFHAMSI
ncbi:MULTISPECIES: hypothetical protein [unclassified Paenibacillus]|uniref:hypothetical protein n=1 Tax=unclassified Paenibacillus TaxID=185978 RepID=UPI001B3CD098|nr:MULTISPECIES: hypothetical protein [unclassified Paenibacillus]MBP1153898.1 hypothetical protein [Paenibacillus sp. PvP091]MBP1170717.1 hypothetical protein [Paenibacillus sp. PvR098]MBP2441745.1 hypothetical protein [Paenibacillus sp. PvP052]